MNVKVSKKYLKKYIQRTPFFHTQNVNILKIVIICDSYSRSTRIIPLLSYGGRPFISTVGAISHKINIKRKCFSESSTLPAIPLWNMDDKTFEYEL